MQDATVGARYLDRDDVPSAIRPADPSPTSAEGIFYVEHRDRRRWVSDLAFPPSYTAKAAARLRNLGDSLHPDHSGSRVAQPNRVFFSAALRAAVSALARWIDDSRDGIRPGSPEELLVDALASDDADSVTEMVQALAWFHVTEAASSAAAIDVELMLDGAFRALGWSDGPSRDADFIVRTLQMSAVVEPPEQRLDAFFIAMCELIGRPEDEIDRWLIEGVHDGLMAVVLSEWGEFETRLGEVGLMVEDESIRRMRLVGLSWVTR